MIVDRKHPTAEQIR